MSDEQLPSAEDAHLFKLQIQEKIQKLLDEFAMGKISREQFHTLYKRYSDRLEIADHAVMTGKSDLISHAQAGPPTLDIRAKTEGKPVGMMVYHHPSHRALEKLGNFSVVEEQFAGFMDDISEKIKVGKVVETRVENTVEKRWLIFTTAASTTVITQFRNEPSRKQIRDIERLHHDFEEANRTLLAKDIIDTNALAYPFLVFVKQLRK